MPFNWISYIELAKELLEGQRGKDPYQEANLRTVISRAYYGVFCIARNHLENNGIEVPQVDAHKFVREIYIASKGISESRIGENLGRLLRRRNIADYENDPIINFSEANTAYQQAYRTLQFLSNLGAC
jgi:uncharacterized protein (UPF0332 family)